MKYILIALTILVAITTVIACGYAIALILTEVLSWFSTELNC